MATKTKTPDPRPAVVWDGMKMTWTDRPDLSRCEYKTEKGRRCRLVVHGGDTEHAMILRTGIPTPKSLAELREAGALNAKFTLPKMEAVPTTENLGREYKREAGPRDADQRRVDTDVKRAYDAWVKAGKPEKFENSPVQRYIFPPAAFDTIILMLRRATQTGGPVVGKSLKYRRKTHESGNAMVYFTVTDGSKKNGN